MRPQATTLRNYAKTAHRPTPDEVGRAAGLRIRKEMERRAVYRRRTAPAQRYRRARLLETASVTRYPAEQPAAAPVASYQEQTQPGMPAYGDAAVHYQPGTAVAATEAQRATQGYGQGSGQSYGSNYESNYGSGSAYGSGPAQFQASSPQAPTAAGHPLAEAAVESPNDSPNESADEPAAGLAAGERSESEVASLTIPHGAMPAPLKGSLASLERQNDRLTAEGLERIENEDDLAARIANHLLVPVPASDGLTVNPALPPNHRYCRPWTARFLADLARDHAALFHRPLEVSSAVRTVEYQRRLMRINGNAAPAEGDVVSPHLTGATIDIAKEGLTRSEMSWMRQRLLQLEDAGKIDVEEEFQQSCFHITVYTTYAPARGTRRSVHGRPQDSQPSAPAESADGSDTQGL